MKTKDFFLEYNNCVALTARRVEALKKCLFVTCMFKYDFIPSVYDD